MWLLVGYGVQQTFKGDSKTYVGQQWCSYFMTNLNYFAPLFSPPPQKTGYML